MSRILDRLYHLHWVTPDVARSAQPYLGFYGLPCSARLQEPDQSARRECRFLLVDDRKARGLGARDRAFRREIVVAQHLPSRSGLAALFDAFAAAERPVLLKCSGGQDRTGLAAALYVLQSRGPGALDQAEGQLASWPYLHFPKRHQLWLRHFPGYANAQAGGTSLGQWAHGGTTRSTSRSGWPRVGSRAAIDRSKPK